MITGLIVSVIIISILLVLVVVVLLYFIKSTKEALKSIEKNILIQQETTDGVAMTISEFSDQMSEDLQTIKRNMNLR